MIKNKFVSPVLMWMIVFIGILFILTFVTHSMLFPRGIINIITLSIGIILWLYFFIGAIYVHRKAALSVERIDKVIRTGVYRYVRHPIYTADIFLAWSIFSYFPFENVLFSAMWLTMILILWANLEEKRLIKKFGDEYKKYRDEVPMFIPFIKWTRNSNL